MSASQFSRVLVVGPTGCGKSYAARRIADRIDRPLVQLDRIMLDPITGRPKEKERFVEEAFEYFRSPDLQAGWVVDGTYRSLRPLTWERADVIGYIRPCLAQNVRRLIQRCVTGDLSGGQSTDSLPTQLKRLRATRAGDLQKIDSTTQEFREKGTPVIEEPTSSRLLAVFALYRAANLPAETTVPEN